MQCPFCTYAESKVIDSRAVNEGVSIRTTPRVFALYTPVYHV